MRGLSKSAPPGAAETPAFLTAVGPHERQLWRLLVIAIGSAALGLLFGAAALWGLGGLGLTREDLVASAQPPMMRQALSALTTSAIIASLGLGVLIAAVIVHRRSPWTFITAAPRFRWGLFGAGLLLFAVLQGGLLLATGWTDISATHLWAPAPLGEKAAFVLTVLAVGAPTAFAEEVMFRGWLMQQIAAFTRRVPIILLVSSLVFSLLHIHSEAPLFVAQLMSGLAYGWSVLRLGGLEFAVGAHLAKNAVLTWFVEIPGSSAPDDFNLAVAAIGGGALALIVCVEFIARRSPAGRLPG